MNDLDGDRKLALIIVGVTKLVLIVGCVIVLWWRYGKNH